MPSIREPEPYKLYIEARKVWRSKIEWQLTHEEATRILTDVRRAADLGDWGARALMARFYLEGLGPLDSNNVLSADPVKAVDLARMAAKAGQPWGVYDLGVAYEHGYGGVPVDSNLAWAYYLRAAQLGSPEAQMALASAYGDAERFEDEETMIQCAYKQGHGPAALALGVNRRAVREQYREAMAIFHNGVKFGSRDCASALEQLFRNGLWILTDDKQRADVKAEGIEADAERATRYKAIFRALEINPDLKLTNLDAVLPLPPAILPEWKGVADAVEPESKAPPTY